jgi:transcriptional regulator with XRE-family HTH domain
MPTLGRFIRRRRIELGLTQEQMASLIGDAVRQSEVSRLENDRILLPRRERLERIATVLQVPLGELLVRSGWAGADEALVNVSPSPRPTVQPASSVLELLDEIKGLIDEVQFLLRDDEAERAAGLLEAARVDGMDRCHEP